MTNEIHDELTELATLFNCINFQMKKILCLNNKAVKRTKKLIDAMYAEGAKDARTYYKKNSKR